MRDYMIYKLENTSTADEVMSFYLPERGDDCNDLFRRKVKRILDLRSYKNSGYIITGVLYVDKETYLNARLDAVVADYCKTDKHEQEVRLNRHMYKSETLHTTLEMIQDYKWTCLKQLSSLVRRLQREDFDINNEIALMLYDKYLESIL